MSENSNIEARARHPRTHESLAQLAILKAFGKFELNPASNEHGLPHWSRVWSNGLTLARLMPKNEGPINLEVVTWFAFLHDCCRQHDFDDPGHGPRASQFASRLRDEGALVLEITAFHSLCVALNDHSKGLMDASPTVRVCWDADRLDLPRVGVLPDPDRMCTQPGARAARQIAKGIRSVWA